MNLHLRSDFQYVGESVLGNVDFLDLDQGDYFQLNAGAGLDTENWTLEFTLSNILNNRANRFSLGNPFSVAGGQQITPLRPITGRLSFRYKF